MHVERNKIQRQREEKMSVVKMGKRELTKNYIFFTKKKLMNPVAKFIVPDCEI
jgi:hypothetical protein